MASDDESAEDFVTYGTPLEPLEEDEPLRKPIPIHDQTVKDEKGRYKRFHGAFTGGFSAGYFNSVGSKEGWTPSTFLSSRQQKAGKQEVRPEDFMDEEDLGEHGIAPHEITTTDDFASGRRNQIRDKARAISSLTGPIPGDTLLEDLVAPARTSIGVELLRKMGWKDGQGVGPRVKRKPRKHTADVVIKAYGCALPPNGSEESEDDDEEFAPENVTFAPKDVTPIDFTPKDDMHGLGYRGLNPQQALMGSSGAGHINLFTLDSDRASSLFGDRKLGQKRRGGVSGQAFGVGAMEEEDDDIYHRDTMSNYDTILGGEEPGDGLYGWTAPKQYNRKKDSKKDASYLGKILEGFTLASDSTETKTVFAPPSLPRDYRPVHYFRPVIDLSTASPLVAQALQASKGHMSQDPEQKGRHQLDSSQRRELLGESSLQGPSSVFDLLDPKDREKLTAFRRGAEEKRTTPDISSEQGRAAAVAAGVAAAKASAQQALSSRFQSTASQAEAQIQAQASQALTVWSGPTADASQIFKPFDTNPHKQARYDLYINKLKQGDKDALELSLDPSMIEWERGRERDEFVRAALLYKPSSSHLASRFTRAKHEDDRDTVEVTRDQENDVDDKQAAVTMKMFGKLTRDSFEWHPDKLLCKRFNVPNPYPESGIVGMPKVKRDRFSVFNFLTMTDDSGNVSASRQSASPSPQAAAAPRPTEGSKRSRWDVSAQASKAKDPLSEFLSMARSEASVSQPDQASPAAQTEALDPIAEQQNNEEEEEDKEEEESRPPMDLFKAIFASSSDEKSSSSSEDEDDEDQGEEMEQGVREGQAGTHVSGPFNITTNPPAPPASTQAAAPQLSTSVTEMKSPWQDDGPAAALPSQAGNVEDEEFGPRLPPPSLPGERLTLLTPSAQEETHKKKCKEKHKAKKEHKHKKEKKHKKKHKKHKHKGKKKKRAEESGGSSEDSDSDDDAESGTLSTEELLRRLKSLREKKLQ